LLLGRKVLVCLPDGPPESQLTAGVVGLVVAIYVQSGVGESAAYAHYAVHVQFDSPVQEADLKFLTADGCI
jgi:hypothetical protein